MITDRYLYMPETTKSPRLCQRSLYVGTHLQHSARQFTNPPCPSPPAHTVSEGYAEVSSQDFLRSFLSMCISLWVCGAFKSPCGHHISQLFCFKDFLVSLLFSWLLLISSGTVRVKHWLFLFLTNTFGPLPRPKAFCFGQVLSLPCMWGLARDLPVRSVNYSSLRTRLWKSSCFTLFSLVAVKLIWEFKITFLGYCAAREHGIGPGQVKTPQSSLVLPRSCHFSSITAPQVAVQAFG